MEREKRLSWYSFSGKRIDKAGKKGGGGKKNCYKKRFGRYHLLGEGRKGEMRWVEFHTRKEEKGGQLKPSEAGRNHLREKRISPYYSTGQGEGKD